MAIESINQYTYYQWDIGRILEVTEEYLSYIFLFQNEGAERSYISRATRKTRGEEVYGEVPIPNIIFQQSGNAYAYYCDGIITETEETDEYGNTIIRISNLKTIARQTLSIHKRGKPNDYVYTEEDLLSYMTYGDNLEKLNAQLDQMEEQFITFSSNMGEEIYELRADLNAYQGGAEAVYSHLEKRISRIEQHIDQDYFITDDSVAYTKEVPMDVCTYAQLNSIGGMTYKCDNLLKIKSPNNNPWIQDSAECRFDNGIITVNSSIALARTVTFTFETEIELVAGKEYWVSSGQNNTSTTTWRMYITPTVQGAFASKYTITAQGVSLGPISANTGCKIYIQVYEGAQPKNIVFTPTISYASISSNGTPYFEGLRDSKVTAVMVHGANLIPFPYETASITSEGVTFTALEDGGVKVLGTSTGWASFVLATSQNIKLLHGQTYVISGNKDNCSIVMAYKDGGQQKYLSNGNSIVWDDSFEMGSIYLQVSSGNTTDTIVYPMFNYGTSAVPYKKYIPPVPSLIPTEITSLEGYGKGVGNYSNVYNFENGQYIKRCLTYTFNGSDNENWMPASATHNDINYMRFYLTTDNTPLVVPCIGDVGLCSNFNLVTFDDRSKSPAGSWCITSGGAIQFIIDASFDNVIKWKNYLKEHPVTIVYAIAEPINTELSVYFDNLLNVEVGGSLELVNEYNNAVPSSITYLKKEGSI